MIDFTKRTIRFDRRKVAARIGKAVPRVAVLWPSTCEALQAIKNNHSHVFISVYGVPVGYDMISRHWHALCKKAGLTRDLTFGNLRDTAQTVAAASTDPVVPQQQYQVLAGHTAPGVDDHYISRHPHFVANACEAIRKHFGL